MPESTSKAHFDFLKKSLHLKKIKNFCVKCFKTDVSATVNNDNNGTNISFGVNVYDKGGQGVHVTIANGNNQVVGKAGNVRDTNTIFRLRQQ